MTESAENHEIIEPKKSKGERLAEARQTIKDLQAVIADITKKLDHANQRVTAAQEERNAANAVTEEMHMVLDLLPGAAPRKTGDDWNAKPYSLAARFSSWIAARTGGAA